MAYVTDTFLNSKLEEGWLTEDDVKSIKEIRDKMVERDKKNGQRNSE